MRIDGKASERYDVVVVGAGHAGCEAAVAAARIGARVALVTLNLDLVAQMSCNPAVGGIAKGHLVREIDALGGVMGQVTDDVGIQFRLLNTSRGPAVWSPRAQCDKKQYRIRMKQLLECEPNLDVKQAEVVDLITRDGRIDGVELLDGRRLAAGAVIITTGTFLNGLVHIGERTYPAGRSGEPASVMLGEVLRNRGFRCCRLKTGTPPRLDGRTIDWNSFKPQPGDPEPTPFSFRTESITRDQVQCHIAYTNESTHKLLQDSLVTLAAVQRPDRGRGTTLLPVDRGQGGEVSPSCPASDLPRARGPGHERGVRERHVHQHADRRSGGHGGVGAGPGAGRDDPARLCHRVRLGGRDRIARHA